MKDDGEEFNDFVDDNLFFVENLSIEDGDDGRAGVGEDHLRFSPPSLCSFPTDRWMAL